MAGYNLATDLCTPVQGNKLVAGETMAKSESTSQRVGAVRSSKIASKAERSVAASALTQKSSGKATSKAVASAAAKILKDPNSSKAAKSAAASALTQKPRFKAKGVDTESVYKAVYKYWSKREA